MFDPVFSRILVAYDGSEPSKNALEIAARMATIFKGEIIILTAVPPQTFPVFPTNGYSGVPPITTQYNYLDRIKELYQKALDEAETHVKNTYPGLRFEKVLREGRPSALIVEEADKKGADLIIMGNRGLGGISGWILGSTSRRVVDHCTKPILVVK
jgi:nucleotide-binding universal stress UspA family protein